MFEGQILFKGCTIYSPWFPRQGDSVRLTLEVAAISGATIRVDLVTKNTEDPGDGLLADQTGGGGEVKISVSATGRTNPEWRAGGNIGLKELCRYKFTVTGTNNYDWVLFRMLPPVWFDALSTS